MSASATEIEFEKKLSINVRTVKDGENTTLKNYFGLLLRSDVVVDPTHKYCNECLKQEKVVR